MNDTTTNEVNAAEAATEKALANIVRGTLPHPLVYLIRFDETSAKDADVAKKYGTTTGKVADIKKGRNFGYIDMEYVPTAEAKTAAIEWLKRVPNYDEVGTDSAASAVERMNVATEADVEALKVKRAAIRAKGESTDADGTPKPPKAPKEPKAKKAKGSAPASAEDADSLMA